MAGIRESARTCGELHDERERVAGVVAEPAGGGHKVRLEGQVRMACGVGIDALAGAHERAHAAIGIDIEVDERAGA